MPALNLYIPEKDHDEAKEALKKLPRGFSLSKLIKWIIFLVVLSERDLKAYVKLHPDEVGQVRDQLWRIVDRLKEVVRG